MSDASLQESVSLESLVAGVADEFRERQKNGERPKVEEYAARHPEAAELLRKVLTALEVVGLSLPDSASLPEDELSGALGDFRLLREVGRGGMGVVYEAEQISLRRRVALKVLPFAATMDPRHLQRFHNEAQAAACLHHTNIVPVFFVGCERGVHFYAMQFIDGQPLSDLIRQLRGREKTVSLPAGAERTAAYQPTPGDNSATLRPVAEKTPLTGEGRRGRDYYRKVAELGVQAAEALDHAHQLGIVHRDIKPANLLLDNRGNLWVTDFGLAHVRHSEASLTVSGQMVGTPRYMSPEQALAQRVPIDHRTDVYSLGATLYELLTLRPAFESEDRHELLQQISSEEPARPRRRNKDIPAELEIIVLKAMEKRPQDRYGTAKELADDLRRWLLDQPIRARRPGLIQRAAKWGRRHRPLVVAAVLCLFLALVMLAISNVVIWREHEETREALRLTRLHQKEVDLQAFALGEARVKSAMKVQSSLRAMDAILTALEDSFPAEEREFAPMHKAVSDQAIAFYRHLLPLESHDPSSLQEMTWAYVRLGKLCALRNRFAEAQQAYSEARRTENQLIRLAKQNVLLGRTEQPSLLHADALLEGTAIEEKVYQEALTPWRLHSPKGLATILDYRIGILEGQGIPEEPPQGIRLWERIAEELPSLRSIHHLVNLYWKHGASLQKAGRVEDAKANFRQAVKHAEKSALARKFKEEPESATHTQLLANVLFEIASELADLDAAEDAASALRITLGLYERLAHADPLSITLTGENKIVLGSRGSITLSRKKTVFKSNPKLPSEIQGTLHCNVGLLYWKAGYLDGAITEYREAIRLHKDLAEAHCNLGAALEQKGQFTEALEHRRRGHELGSRNPRWPHPSCEWVRNCERFVELDGKLPEILSGPKKPADTVERLALAQLCQMPCKKRYTAATRFYCDAFAAEPKLADDLNTQHRYNAACAAALAGCGQGKDADKLDSKERARLRQQALDWLRADLKAYRQLMDKSAGKADPVIAQRMQLQHWLGDTDFAGLRGEEALAKLPEAERQAWHKLWQEVEALRLDFTYELQMFEEWHKLWQDVEALQRWAAATTKSAEQRQGKEGSPRKD